MKILLISAVGSKHFFVMYRLRARGAGQLILHSG